MFQLRGDWILGQLIVIVCYVQVSIAQDDAYLQILPSGAEQQKALHGTLFLTCSAMVPNPELITNLQWTGPTGEPIPRETRKYSEYSPPDKVLLFINGIREDDEGTYHCTAKYAGEQELKASVTITTFLDITWEDVKLEQHVTVNSDAKIQCKVKARPVPNIDWQKDGKQFKNTDRCKIESDGIMCRGITQQDEGQYICRARVTATGRMDEKAIRVIVDIPPKIDSLFPEYNAIEDEMVTMTCSATGKPIPNVMWVDKNKSDLSKLSGYLVDELSGQLTIEKVSREDHGVFTCIVENGAGRDEKDTRLLVVSKPKIKEFKNITAEKEGEVKIICRVSAEPQADITVVKKSSQRVFELNQQFDERIMVDVALDGEDQVFTVTIKEVRDEDDGLYVCTARNEGSTVTATGHLMVEFAPVFDLMSHVPVKSWERNVVNLTCIARSIPNASIEWYSVTRDISRDSNIKKFGDGPVSTLQVRTMDNTYYMEYRCKASNKLGSKEAYMRIEEAFVPKDIRQADIQTITATTVTFIIVGPTDTGGMPITHYVVEYTDEKGEVKIREWTVDSSYILAKLEAGKKYTFKFAARNAVGTGPFTHFKERVMPRKGVPEEPLIVLPINSSSAVSSYSDKIDVHWKIPADNGEPIDSFIITYYPVQEGSKTRIGESVTAIERYPSTHVQLHNVQPNTYYRVEVRAHNIIGNSRPGQVTIRTAHGTVSDLQQMQVTNVSLGFILGIVVAVFLILLIVVDVSCYFVNKCGLLMCLCTNVCGQEHPRDKSKDGIMESGKERSRNPKAVDGEDDDKLEDTPMINGDKEKEALKDALDNDVIRNKSPHGSKSSIAKDSPV